LSQRRYTVVAGSFSKEANALELQKKFAAEGLPSDVVSVTIDSKMYFRVMSGLFDERSAAEAWCRELRQKDLSGQPYIKTLQAGPLGLGASAPPAAPG
jgi:cell division protein FtsN